MSHRFALLVPVKGGTRAKSRLAAADGARGMVVEPAAGDLALAFALDAIEAARACPEVGQVYVVTAHPDGIPADVRTLPDEGGGDLNAALGAAEAVARTRHPELGVAAMCADLPCLRTGDLTEALRAADGLGRWFVPDAAGSGTTLLGAPPGVRLRPRFGERSAARHRDGGAVALTVAAASVRLDVDTPDDLERALALGVGPHTAALLGR